MALKHNVYFHFFVILLSVLAIYSNVTVGLVYLLAGLPLIFFTSSFFLEKVELKQVFLVASYCIWVFNFPRALFLINNPDYFSYPLKTTIKDWDHITALSDIGLYSILFLSTFWVLTKNIRLEYKTISAIKDKFLNKKQLIIMFSLALLLLKTVMQLAAKTLGGGMETIFELSKLVLPFSFILPIVLVLWFLFKQHLSPLQRTLVFVIIILNVLGAFLQGSKAVLLSLILYIFFVKIIQNYSLKIKLGQFVALFIFVGIPVAGSIILMQVARSSLLSESGIDYNLLFNAFVRNISNEIFLFNALNSFTSRLNGYDGLLIASLNANPEILKVFSLNNVLLSYLDKLLPLISTDSVSLGKGIGLHLSNLPKDFKHAGALGAFGSIKLFFRGYGMIGIVIAASIYTLVLRFLKTVIKEKSLFIIFTIIWFNSLILFLNAGNFDVLAQGLTIQIFQLIFYFFVLRIIWAIIDSLRKA
jgi:hypothetical protein